MPCNSDGSQTGLEWDSLTYDGVNTTEPGAVSAEITIAGDSPIPSSSGTLTGYFKYSPAFYDWDDGQVYGPSDTVDTNFNNIPPPPATPSKQAFEIDATLACQTIVSGSGTAVATASLPKYGDTFTSTDGIDPVWNYSTRKHIVQVGVDGGIATVSIDGAATTSASCSDDSTDASAMAWGEVTAYAFDTDLGVTINYTTNARVPLLDASGQQTVDANSDLNFTTAPHTPNPDGTMDGDTIYSYHIYTQAEDGNGTPTFTDVPAMNWVGFTPSFTGSWPWIISQSQPDSWNWSPSESDDTWNYGKCEMPWA